MRSTPVVVVLALFSAAQMVSAQSPWRPIDATMPRGEFDPESGAVVGLAAESPIAIHAWDGAESREIAKLELGEAGIDCVRDRRNGGFLLVSRGFSGFFQNRTLRNGVLSPPIQGTVVSIGEFGTDPLTGQLLFLSSTTGGGTMLWNGSAWSGLSPQHSPPLRSDAAMCTDTARNRVVLFGGRDAVSWTALGDTWEWDGTDWTSVTTSNAPPARFWHAMAFDERLGRSVLFGGQSGATELPDTWEYDGVAWTLSNTSTAPPGVTFAQLTWFPPLGRTLASSGASAGLGVAETWDYDGSSWSLRAFRSMPRPRQFAAIATDLQRGRLVMFGGSTRLGSFTAYHGDTWEWDGLRWSAAAATGPAARAFPVLAHDGARQRIVLFGGLTSGFQPTYFPETWTYDGTAWTSAATTGPAARAFHSMTFSPGAASIILFGGQDAAGVVQNDTWSWNGSSWSNLTPGLTISPPARVRHGMAHDPVHQELLLFGGSDGTWGGELGDTWTFAGSWTLRSLSGPGDRTDPVVATDRASQRIVMSGGTDLFGTFTDTWEWDGTAWQRISTVGLLASSGVAATDPISGRVVTLPSSAGPMAIFTPTPATATSYTQGCPGSAGVPVLRAVGAPRLGESEFTARIDNALANTLSGLMGDTMQVVGPIGNGCWRALGTPITLGFVVTNTNGHATYAIPVPQNAALRGQRLLLQGAVFDPQGAYLGVAAITQGLRVSVGD